MGTLHPGSLLLLTQSPSMAELDFWVLHRRVTLPVDWCKCTLSVRVLVTV